MEHLKGPNCRGFTAEKLSGIDFSKLDLSEIVDDVMDNFKKPPKEHFAKGMELDHIREQVKKQVKEQIKDQTGAERESLYLKHMTLSMKGAEEKESSEIKQKQTEQYPATAELKKYQAELEETKAKAVLHPTAQNVLKYQQMQYEMIEKSGEFADVLMKNVYLNPNVDVTQNVPTFPHVNRIYLAEQHKKKTRKIKQLSQEYGLFLFFKKQCPYCKAFAPIVKIFSDKYNWKVLATSEFGEKLSMFERSVQDNGLVETWGVNSYPSLFAVNPKTGHVIPIANRMISVQEMEERIMPLTGEKILKKQAVAWVSIQITQLWEGKFSLIPIS